jgi:hypothetical protein
MGVALAGKRQRRVTTGKGQFVTQTDLVPVRHGRLRLELVGRGGPAVLDALLIVPAAPGSASGGAGHPAAHFLTDPNRVFAVPTVARPGYLVPFTDPTFGTVITRIANDPGAPLVTPNTGVGVWSSDARHNYQINSAWNADSSLIYLENRGGDGGSPEQLYLNGSTYAVEFGTPTNMPGGAYDQRWNPNPAHADEVILAGTGTSTLYWFDVVHNVVTRSWALPMPVTYIGNTKGNPSQDGRFVVLGDATHMFMVDMDPQAPYAPYPNGRVGPVYDLGAEGLPYTVDSYSVSPSGKYVVVHYEGDYLRVFDVNPVTLALTPRPMPASYPGMVGSPAQGFIYGLGHSDMALDPFDNNQDVIIGQEHAGNVGDNVPGVHTVNGDGIGHVVMVRLSDGAVTSLTDPGNGTSIPYEAYASHISCRDIYRPGWCYVSYYPGAGERYGDEVIAVKMDGSGTVERFAHHHSDFGNFTGTAGPYEAADPDFDYRSEPHAVPSPDGRRVLFASNWLDHGTGGGPIEDYVIDTGL